VSKQGFPRTFTCTFNRWRFRLQFETTRNQDELTVKSDMLRDGRPLTEREHELWRPWQVFVIACIVKNLAEANGYEKLAADLTKWSEDYEKAVFGNFRSREERKAVNFVLTRRREILLAAATGRTISDGDQIKLLDGRVKAALDNLDVEFSEYLAKAIHLVRDRISSSKGTGEHLDRWLLEYKLRISCRAQHTVRELNEQFVSKFRSISDKELRERCRKFDVPLKPDKRGKAAVRYGRNVPSPEEKGLIR
jgi:hypothetical protein